VYETILIGYDRRDGGRDALALARLLAETTGATLLIASVFPYEVRQMGTGPFQRALAEERREGLDPLLDQLGGSLRAEVRALGAHSPPRALHELAEQAGADLVVLGSSERAPLGRILAGSTAQRLLHGSPCPVAVAPRGYREREPGLRVIGVAFDDTPESRAALRHAAQLAGQAAAALRIIGVLPRLAAERYAEAAQARLQWRTELRDAVHQAAGALPGELRAQPIVIEKGDPADAIVEQAEQGIDLLVSGSRGYGPVRGVLLGSVSSRLMSSAPCPVLVVARQPAAGAPNLREPDD